MTDNLLTLLAAFNIDIAQTPYANNDDFFYQYPLHYLGRINAVKHTKYSNEFPSMQIIENEAQMMRQSNQDLNSELKCLSSLLAKYQTRRGNLSSNCNEQKGKEYRELIDRKKELRNRRHQIEHSVAVKIRSRYGVDISRELSCIKIRNLAILNTVDNVVQLFPQLQHSYLTRKRKVPLFTYNLREFADRIKTVNSAIEGGTCLIGVDEIYLALKYRNGQVRYFDVVTGSEEGSDNVYEPRRYDLFNVITEDNRELIEVKIIEKGFGPSLHNIVELYRLMWLAKKLDLPLVIGLPDDAYKKLLCAVVAPLEFIDELRVKLNSMIDRLTDRFIGLIFEINRLIKVPAFEVLHSRNEKLVSLFKKNRQQVAAHVGRLSNPIKKEAIIDYNCMPAVPYFLWGSTNILEISDIMEIENLKASMRLFPDISFSALAFPYIPDIKNISSMYHGKSDNKIFLADYHFKDIISNKNMMDIDDTILRQLPWI